MLALLIILGILGLYSTESAALRSTVREAQAYDRSTTVEAVDYSVDGMPYAAAPGLPY
jgi:hypothetical protein